LAAISSFPTRRSSDLRLVQPGSWFLAERIRDELLCCQFGPIIVATSDANSSNVQFPRNAYGHSIGIPGELHIGGVGVGRGYNNRDRKSTRLNSSHVSI